MSVSDKTASELTLSVNGFEELAIARQFKHSFLSLQEIDTMLFGRALAFVHFKRTDLPDVKAYEAAMSLTISDINDFFVPEPEEDKSDLGDESPKAL